MSNVSDIFSLNLELPLPEGIEETVLFEWLKTVHVENASSEIVNYCIQDFKRFIYTFGLVKSATINKPNARCLELGANPYFMTMLLKKFTSHEIVLANYFGNQHSNGLKQQSVSFAKFNNTNDEKEEQIEKLDYFHFNIEEDFPYPFESSSFDVVLFCEIIEHLLMDPVKVLREIKRILKPSGRLILTTPNVARLENVSKILAGDNIYDPYSAYGAYGRHNREFNKHELNKLLNYVGFDIQEMFSADVHANNASEFFKLDDFIDKLKFRKNDLGQYIFLRAACKDEGKSKKPSWLYRSYPPDELED